MTRSDLTQPLLLPPRWETARLVIEDGRSPDVSSLHAIFSACAYVAPWDDTFREVPLADLVALVNRSQTAVGEDYRFKLQCVREKATGEIAGYFHVSHGAPEPHTVWISILVFHPDFQKQQYGRETIDGLCHQLLALGYEAIWLKVYLKNWPALRFWISNGFTKILKYEGDKTLTPSSYAAIRLERKLR